MSTSGAAVVFRERVLDVRLPHADVSQVRHRELRADHRIGEVAQLALRLVDDRALECPELGFEQRGGGGQDLEQPDLARVADDVVTQLRLDLGLAICCPVWRALRGAAEKEIHVIDTDGRIYKNADAILKVLEENPKLAWLARLGRLRFC